MPDHVSVKMVRFDAATTNDNTSLPFTPMLACLLSLRVQMTSVSPEPSCGYLEPRSRQPQATLKSIRQVQLDHGPYALFPEYALSPEPTSNVERPNVVVLLPVLLCLLVSGSKPLALVLPLKYSTSNIESSLKIQCSKFVQVASSLSKLSDIKVDSNRSKTSWPLNLLSFIIWCCSPAAERRDECTLPGKQSILSLDFCACLNLQSTPTSPNHATLHSDGDRTFRSALRAVLYAMERTPSPDSSAGPQESWVHHGSICSVGQYPADRRVGTSRSSHMDVNVYISQKSEPADHEFGVQSSIYEKSGSGTHPLPLTVAQSHYQELMRVGLVINSGTRQYRAATPSSR
ncbi:hypothetical protein B0H11DRAFT_1914817 [Mycena galericulata]|nr:hypothetical protein B0H11DRAFT_1914817 [Mycena galericulata]